MIVLQYNTNLMLSLLTEGALRSLTHAFTYWGFNSRSFTRLLLGFLV